MEKDIVIQQDGGMKKKRIWFLVPIIVLVLLGIGVLIWAIIPRDYDKVTVLNANELVEKVGSGEVNNFRQELLNLLRENNIIGENDRIDDVVVREGTVTSGTDVDEDGGYQKTTTFLVDIDSIKQTYMIKMIESDVEMDGITAQIYCPKLSESKYPESKCNGIYFSNNNSIDYRLPQELYLATGEKILIKAVDVTKKQEEWKSTIQVYLYSCDASNPPVGEAEKMVQNWVKESGDDFEYYTYNIRAGYCEGDAI